MDESIWQYITQKYQSRIALSWAYSSGSYCAQTGAFGLNFLDVLNQQLQLSQECLQKPYTQFRHYLVDKLTAILSAHPDDFIEGDLGEVQESFTRLEDML